jgi:hypothetical protein
MNNTLCHTTPGPDALTPRGAALDYKTYRGRLDGLVRALEEIDLAPGQYRKDAATGRYVRLVKPQWEEHEVPEGYEDFVPWLVEDVLTGQGYMRAENMLWDEPPVPEMQVLAWAADDHPEIDISGD